MAFPVSLVSKFDLSKFASVLVAACIGAAAMGHAAKAGEKSLKVIVDRAKVVRLNTSAATVIIGNPAIVDATIQDSRTLVLTGRSFGVTNLIVLDSNGDPVVDETVVVQAHESHSVRIYRQMERQTMACSPICEPTLTIGDTTSTFSSVLNQINARNQLSDPKK